jgi:hypothetical protein
MRDTCHVQSCSRLGNPTFPKTRLRDISKKVPGVINIPLRSFPDTARTCACDRQPHTRSIRLLYPQSKPARIPIGTAVDKGNDPITLSWLRAGLWWPFDWYGCSCWVWVLEYEELRRRNIQRFPYQAITTARRFRLAVWIGACELLFQTPMDSSWWQGEKAQDMLRCAGEGSVQTC